MSGAKDGGPDGTEARGHPDNGRDRTEAVLEDAMPDDQQRKPRSGDAAVKSAAAANKTKKRPAG